jgi:ribosomal protein S18 acetylase RimI-like enzyme
MADIIVRRLGSDDWQLLRTVRLASLADAPYAYGSTLALEREYTEADWRVRLERPTNVHAVAELDGEPVGMTGAYHHKHEPDIAYIFGVWVSPAARGRGVGDATLREVLGWATERGDQRVMLHVVETNEHARKLFLRNGFSPTGEFEPLESNPDSRTEIMRNTLQQRSTVG